MAPPDHPHVTGRGPTPPRPTPLLPVLLLTLAACTEAPPPEVEVDPVQASPAAAVPAPIDTASPQSAPTDPLDPVQEPPAPATIDSLTAQLAEIAAAQQLILSRLDSLQSAAPPAAGSPAIPLQAPGESPNATAQEPPDSALGLELPDLEEATEDVRSIGLGIALSLLVILVFHFLIRAVIWVLDTLAERSTARRLSFKWLIPITRMVLWAIAVYLIVNNIFR
ncbi:MAG: hypothetical protein OXF01_05630, partial [Gemmatimonadetes bacterium]|nr:hypothetical protein [Gemmatimonadota bacterium]